MSVPFLPRVQSQSKEIGKDLLKIEEVYLLALVKGKGKLRVGLVL